MTEITAEERRKTYPSMKDSGVPWLGETPNHWKTERAKWLFRKMDQPVRENDEVVTCFRDGVVTLRKNRRLRGFTESLKEIGYQGIRRGDLVIHAMDAFAGAIGVSDSDGKGTPVYSVCSPRQSANAYYYAFCIREMARSEWILALAKGIRERSTDFRFNDFASQWVPLPPFPEQAAIVRFLNHADRRIRRYIRAKEKLIALLEEQKQAIIHEAVTGQIDVRTRRPYRVYKDPGVKWLGQVPEHWQILRLKDVATVQTGITLGKDYRSTRTISRPYLRVANVQDGHLKLAHVKSVDVPIREAEGATLHCGDVLMTEGGDIDKLGRGCVWRNEVHGCLHQNHIFAVRCTRGPMSPEFLVRLMASQHGRMYFELTAKRTTNLASTNSSTLRAFPVPLPLPEEQAAILDVISAQANALEDAMNGAEKEVELMREYRTRVIADVVTGKLDVREAATGLPKLDPLAAEEGPDDEFNRHRGSGPSRDAEEGGPLPDVVEAERSEPAAGKSIVDGM